MPEGDLPTPGTPRIDRVKLLLELSEYGVLRWDSKIDRLASRARANRINQYYL